MFATLLTPAPAQTFQAQITGVVRDPSGAVIPNARVVATNIATESLTPRSRTVKASTAC